MASPAGSTTTKPAPSRKPAATTKRSSTTARKPAATRSAPSTAKRASNQATTAKRNATIASNARSRAARATKTEAKSGAVLVGAYAERAVLVPVGAALAGRDRVMDIVSEIMDTFSTRKKTEAQLKRFERRGITARDRLEREMRRRRSTVGRSVSQLDRRREKATKRVTERVDDVSTQIQDVAAKMQETVKSIA